MSKRKPKDSPAQPAVPAAARPTPGDPDLAWVWTSMRSAADNCAAAARDLEKSAAKSEEAAEFVADDAQKRDHQRVAENLRAEAARYRDRAAGWEVAIERVFPTQASAEPVRDEEESIAL